MAEDRRPFIFRAESYVEPVSPLWSAPQDVEYPVTYQEARERLSNQVATATTELAQLPQDRRLDEVVMCVPIHPRFTATSYYPSSFFHHSGLRDVGSRPFQTQHNERQGQSKVFFVRASDQSVAQLEELLSERRPALPGQWEKDIRTLDGFFLPSRENQLMGFSDAWEKGRVEFLLHPFHDSEDELEELHLKFQDVLKEVAVSEESIKFRSYPGGPIFASCYLRLEQLEAVAGFNPLRAVRPLERASIPCAVAITVEAPE